MKINKSIIAVLAGLVLLSAGGSTLWWILGERRKEQQEADSLRLKYSSETSEYIQRYEKWMQLPPEERTQLPLGLNVDGQAKTRTDIQAEQQERLKADLDRLAAGKMTVYPFADDFYGENWKVKLEEYKKQKELSEFILTGSIMCTLSGAVIVGWYIVLTIARFIIWILVGLKNCVKKLFGRKTQSDDLSLSGEAGAKEPQQEQQPENQAGKQPENQAVKLPEKEQQNPPRDLTKVLMNAGWQQPEFVRGRAKIRRQKSGISIDSESCLLNKENNQEKGLLPDRSAQKPERASELKTRRERIRPAKEKDETILKIGHRQLNPIDDTLKDLTQQVSAIREYAANQQNRLEKLQDGYDWSIIKSFCLRVIRCIDNIECRIAQLTEQECDATDLEEFRDELVFALESSGVERFEPEVNSEYRGQEKTAEAVKDKVSTKKPEQRGKIEKVLRPGYQCFIDDENVRIVRPAQVRLYA